jgi:hypothetical protein
MGTPDIITQEVMIDLKTVNEYLKIIFDGFGYFNYYCLKNDL